MSSYYKDGESDEGESEYIPGMFEGASSFNQQLNAWDVSSVTNMKTMFRDASSFNQELNAWDVSSVTNMKTMFRDASSFNQELNAWNVSSVTDMGGMFLYASSFNQQLNAWDVSSVTSMYLMFRDASSFNQDLCPWGDIPTFPYEFVDAMFFGSNCTFQDDPISTNKGPFCASDCIASESPSVSQSPSSSQSPSLSPSSSQSSSSSTLSPGLPEPLPMVRQLYNNESQIENIVSKALLSEQAIATYAKTGVSRSLATAVKPPKPICYYPGNNKCPQVPQKATAASCSCRK
jgi:surface protein